MSISQINNYESKVQPVLRPALTQNYKIKFLSFCFEMALCNKNLW
ncbi:hypothetical protein LEP1GSC082_4008 [Leptospira kirschneri str. H2]|nr:hypothetical protein LEP1GSC082_4008 [Leptospira kirschneri str. H2]